MLARSVPTVPKPFPEFDQTHRDSALRSGFLSSLQTGGHSSPGLSHTVCVVSLLTLQRNLLPFPLWLYIYTIIYYQFNCIFILFNVDLSQ